MRGLAQAFVILGALCLSSSAWACTVSFNSQPREIVGGNAYYDPGQSLGWTLNCPPVNNPEFPWVITGTRYESIAFFPPAYPFFPETQSAGGGVSISTSAVIGTHPYVIHIEGGNFDGGATNDVQNIVAARRPQAPTVSVTSCTYSESADHLAGSYNEVTATGTAVDPDTEAGYENDVRISLSRPGQEASFNGTLKFTPATRGDYTITGTTTNQGLPSVDSTQRTVNCPNRQPWFQNIFGPDNTTVGATTNYTFSNLIDRDTDATTLSGKYMITSKPPGSAVPVAASVTHALFEALSFTPDVPGTYVFSFTVIDDVGAESRAVEKVVTVEGVFNPIIEQRDGQVFVGSAAYLKALLGLPEGASIPDGTTFSWEVKDPQGLVVDKIFFDDPTTGSDLLGPSELYPFFAVQKAGTYSVKLTVSAPLYREAERTFNLAVTNSSVLIFRESSPFSITDPKSFYDLAVPGINHVGFYWSLNNVVYESTPGGATRNLFNPILGNIEIFPTDDGVQSYLPKSVFMHNSPTADRLHDILIEVPIAASLANSMAGFIQSKLGKGYTPFFAGFGLGNLSLQKGTSSSNERYSCIGLIERAAEVAGLNGGQGFMPSILEENDQGKGVLLPSVLHWAIKNPAAAFSDKLVRGKVIRNAVFPPMVRRLNVDTPTNFTITDPVGRKIEVRAGVPNSNGIAGAFVSEKGDIMALAIPEALNGNYTVELVGTGASVDFSLTFGSEEFHFEGMLDVGQTVSGEITVSDQNFPPIVNAGPDRMIFKNQPTVLDGSASYDPELRPLTFNWELLSAPKNSVATVENNNQAFATIIPDRTGTYVFRLTVSDGVNSAYDELKLIAVPSSPRPLLEVKVEQSPVHVGERASFFASTWYIPSNQKEIEVDVDGESDGVELRVERVSDTSFTIEGLLNKTPGTKTAIFRLYQQNARQARGIKEARKALWEKLAKIELALEEEQDPDRRVELLKEKDKIVRERAQLKEALSRFRIQVGETVTKEFEVLP